MCERRQHPLHEWVEQTRTVDAVDHQAVQAIEANPGWRLIHAGIGEAGQTALTYGWPWPAANLTDALPPRTEGEP